MFFRTIITLAALGQVPLALASSEAFSQYFGSPTATANFNGDSASIQSFSFTICTNHGHALQTPYTQAALTSINPQLAQQQADGVCQLCTSLSQSRIDSCCGVATSVDCFAQFAPGNKVKETAAQTTGANSVVKTGSAAATATKSSSGHLMEVGGVAQPALAVLGGVAMALW
ncbi:hypothetical protein EJ08DRAFT_697082 [Tothia fuscella]|uniref:Uncharacterized protein n=1 Tax=Tothia fuscella TaxID=1048955 RepID=A0A9P4NT80_9PEZI|nr:hypothetical protein EJ08DRAFT_697082 [Tothia fuscella]